MRAWTFLLQLATKNKLLTTIALYSSQILPSHKQTVFRWKLINGDNTLRIDYPLTRKSVVFDVGGYEGSWSAAIYGKYQCSIYVFEPVKEYAKKLQNRFQNLKKIHVLPYGLSGKTRNIYLHLAGDATSEFGQSNNVVKVKLISVMEVLKKYKIENIDLIKINIEGGEYDLLEYLIEARLIKKFRNIQVQFHPIVKDAQFRMHKIQKALRKTHTLTYQFSFVWENWTLRHTFNKHP